MPIPHHIALVRHLVIPLVALFFYSGCYHWTPIVYDISPEIGSKIDVLRVGGEDGEVIHDVAHVSAEWPILKGIKEGKSFQIDLRQKSVEKEDLSRGPTIAVAIAIPLGSIGVLTALFIGAVFAHGGPHD